MHAWGCSVACGWRYLDDTVDLPRCTRKVHATRVPFPLASLTTHTCQSAMPHTLTGPPSPCAPAQVANLPIDRNSGFTAPGEKLMELLAAAGLTAETADMFMQRLNAAAQLLSDKEMEGGKRLAGRQGNLNAG